MTFPSVFYGFLLFVNLTIWSQMDPTRILHALSLVFTILITLGTVWFCTSFLPESPNKDDAHPPPKVLKFLLDDGITVTVIVKDHADVKSLSKIFSDQHGSFFTKKIILYYGGKNSEWIKYKDSQTPSSRPLYEFTKKFLADNSPSSPQVLILIGTKANDANTEAARTLSNCKTTTWLMDRFPYSIRFAHSDGANCNITVPFHFVMGATRQQRSGSFGSYAYENTPLVTTGHGPHLLCTEELVASRNYILLKGCPYAEASSGNFAGHGDLPGHVYDLVFKHNLITNTNSLIIGDGDLWTKISTKPDVTIDLTSQ